MSDKQRYLKPIMVVGTSSDAGKSLIAAGLCRIFKQEGFQPAPFKAQNMSLNSYATPEGFEIGRAQAVQAEAAGVAPHTDMNPVLLKPTGETGSQIVLNGKPIGNRSAREYYTSNDRYELFKEVCFAFDRLKEKYNPIVMEGAGSISELNLKHRDITNMRMASYANAATFLVTDIERGGVFGSVYGTIELLAPHERKLIKGIIVNKFRGDASLFVEGRAILENLTKVPVVGVVPYVRDLMIDEEDSVALQKRHQVHHPDKFNIAVVQLSRISNYTDFQLLEKLEGVHVYYTQNEQELRQAKIIILPGSKNTIEDLLDLKEKGLDRVIQTGYQNGAAVIGICGGYQMMGKCIQDPEHVESQYDKVDGLGLLPIETTLLNQKTTEQQTFQFRAQPHTCYGYEIHMGTTRHTMPNVQHVAQLNSGKPEGCYLNERCWGTYLHGVLDNKAVLEQLFRPFRVTFELNLQSDYRAFKETQYDKLAESLKANLDMTYIYKTISLDG